MKFKRTIASLLLATAMSVTAHAEEKVMPGVTAKEVKVGSTVPLSGPAAFFSIIHKATEAYIKKVNENGGVNGRMINFIYVDDAYNPAKTVEQTKRLVERDEVAFMYNSIGTANGLAVRKYLNDKGVPQLAQSSGAFVFNMPEEFPWTTPGLADYSGEASLYAKHLLETMPDAKVAILYQNDDYGKIYLGSFMKTLGDKAEEMVVATESYDITNPTIKAQMLKLSNSGANVLLNVTTGKFSIQSLSALKGGDWKPLHIMSVPAALKDIVFRAAGFDAAKGVITAAISKDISDPQWDNDEDVKEYKKFILDNYGEKANAGNILFMAGYIAGKNIEEIIKRAGDDLSRENIMKVATNYEHKLPLLLPGIKIQITPDDYRPYKVMQLVQFNGEVFKPIGEPKRFAE